MLSSNLGEKERTDTEAGHFGAILVLLRDPGEEVLVHSESFGHLTEECGDNDEVRFADF